MDQVEGVNAGKLELTPKSPKVLSMFNQITLWIDPARGVSVQQRFDEPSGDYRVPPDPPAAGRSFLGSLLTTAS